MAIVNTHYGFCGNRTPTLAGSWLFNEVLTAFPYGLVERVNFTATGGGAERTCTGFQVFGETLNYIRSGPLGQLLAVYDFKTSKWVSEYKTITFAEDATVSEEFMNWLTANATKQS